MKHPANGTNGWHEFYVLVACSFAFGRDFPSFYCCNSVDVYTGTKSVRAASAIAPYVCYSLLIGNPAHATKQIK